MIEVARQEYPDRDTLMRDLAALVADQLRAAHATHGKATLAVPGGTTPGPFLSALSEADLPWPDVRVLPTDERRVSEFSARSNHRLIAETLIRNAAAGAELIALHEPMVGSLEKRVQAVLPLDVLVLGMGADMHTASLFPGAPELAAALAPDAPVVLEITPPSQPEARLTLTAPVLRAASVIHILITGPDKLAALETALADGPAEAAPVRAVLTAPCPVTVHYAA
ncbi:MAG: 6-phosphogluconolactonase [Amaricoccus sp.]|uniref:6-phosphogluconolactonase n=1 Tax=Amaricoccus sp. TaxID=1872485 RepID=UPI0039E277A6